ncbi:hypothetical protein AVXHC19_11050 [Acidovorax sacchari]
MPRRTRPHLLRASFRPDADIDESTYPYSIPAVAQIDQIDFHPNVTFFVGENGAGKSTVLEALARRCAPSTSWSRTIRNSSSPRTRRSCCRTRTRRSSCSTARA